MWAKVGSRLLALVSLVLLGLWLAARVYNAYDIIGPGLRFAYLTIVAVVLISPSALLVTLVVRRRLPLLGRSPAAYVGWGAVGFLWVFVAGTMSLMLGM
jgi:uncharacterized membrane protein